MLKDEVRTLTYRNAMYQNKQMLAVELEYYRCLRSKLEQNMFMG